MRRVSVCLLVVGLVLGLAITATAAETIKIGALTALTGGLGPFGPVIRDGAILAIEQINAAGGVLGKELELVVGDTATDPAVARDAATKLIEIHKVVAFVGALASDTTVAACQIAMANGVVQIAPSSTSVAISYLEDDDFVFRTALADIYQAAVQVRVSKNLGYKEMSVIYVNNIYGEPLAKEFKKQFEAAGGKILAMVPYEQNKPSYRGEVEKAIAGNPDAIFLIAYPVDGNKVLIEAAERGYGGEWTLSDGMIGEAVAPGPACSPEAGTGYIEGAVGTKAGALEVAVAEQYAADYAARFGPSVIPYHMQAYDAVAVIALAIEAGGEATASSIKDNLRNVANPPGIEVTYNEFAKALDLLRQGEEINYQGVSGPVTFDENGDIEKGVMEILVIKDCQFRKVWGVKVGD
ncbi:ABC transporter substrate-binding protein [Candidatus Bipolaricaulota bacterium]|nr:ABC transporter substrate-binding protein [Candidatus Bipolaricaulota bacterium]